MATSSIAISSPTGGENWSGTNAVTWTSVGTTTEQFKIRWNRNNGSWTTIATVAGSDETYNLDTTALTNAADYKIRVELSTDGDIFAQSPNFFTITNTGTPSNNMTIIGENIY